MSWRERVLGPLRERTLEQAQVHHLVHTYDLSRDSRLARIIVAETNQVLDHEEQRRGVRRVRPGELYLRTSRGELIVPIRTAEDIDRLLAGERWEKVRRGILDRCRDLYLDLYPGASPRRVARFLRTLWQGRRPRAAAGQGSPLHGPRRQRPWDTAAAGEPLAHLEVERAQRRLERQPPRPAHRPETLARLQHFLGSEAGIAPALQEPMLLELMALRARFCPRTGMLEEGQMPLAAMHVETGRSLWQPARYQPLAPVVVTLTSAADRRRLASAPPRSYEAYLAFHGARMARVLAEAYVQNGLLSFVELQWIFLFSTEGVSRALDYYQRRHRVILPCPGTVLDMGRMLTHKELVVRLHLEGMTVLEIARQTHHNPRSVDAYLKAFDSVLILHIYGLPPALMAAVMGRGEALIAEYLHLIEQHLKGREEIRSYLRGKGLNVPFESLRSAP